MEKSFDPTAPGVTVHSQHKDASAFGPIIRYTASIKSDSTKCRKDQRHPVHPTKDVRTYTRYDIVNWEVSKVVLDACLWRCSKCHSNIVDENSPYYGKHITTDAFDDYVAQAILSDYSLTENDIASCYGFDRSIVSCAVNKYMKRCKNLTFAHLHCDEIWIVPVKLSRMHRFIVFGKPTKNQRAVISSGYLENDQLVILGIADKLTEEEFKTFVPSFAPEEVEKIYCPETHMIFAAKLAPKARRFALSEPLPYSIQPTIAAVEAMNARKRKITEIRLRVFFVDPFRQGEIRYQGAGYFLNKHKQPHAVSYNTLYLKSDSQSVSPSNHPTTAESCSGYFWMALPSRILELYG